jgi:EmrB/QacA subfamily drug resistance transporter
MIRATTTRVVLATGVPVFMVSLDNLVTMVALPAIHEDTGAGVVGLQWVVNAYVVVYAGLLLTAVGLGDRLGRRGVFVAGIAGFTVASAACALADGSVELVAARAVQGAFAALVMPLSLTLLAAAVPDERRGLAVGLWSAVQGAGISAGPLVGGAVVAGLGWQWIFWLNVPVGLLAVPLALAVLPTGRGPDPELDLPGVLLAGGAVLVAVWAIVDAPAAGGWLSTTTLVRAGVAVLLTVLFILRERSTPAPLLPLRFYRIRAFTLTNLATAAMYFGVFGALFLLVQYLQIGFGLDPLQAGLRTLPWTLAPMVVAPLAGVVAGRIGGGRLMAIGMALQTIGLGWVAVIVEPGIPYAWLVPPLLLGGVGMGLVFAPTAAVVLSSVRPAESAKASGANATFREVGGALGIAALAGVFQAGGDFSTPLRFTEGMVPAVWVGVAVVGAGALAAVCIPDRRAAPRKPEPRPTVLTASAPDEE